jgi:two-component system, cell cycle response regulator
MPDPGRTSKVRKDAAMNSEMLEEILSCPTLPTLPAVALKVIELCSDQNVKFSELAKTIQNDQGLSAKVLRTVNSSFYGLRQPCGTIDKALVMLGLSPVKSLVLGFSLVSSMESGKVDGFDYQDYWRRGLFTAVGGKCMVEAANEKYGDEVFIAGLLQDIGVMALLRALGREYLAVLAQTSGDHRKLVKAELLAFEMQHPDLGAMLAQRWKLPDALVIPVKYHERPTAAPAMHTEIVHGVGLGNLVHDAIVGAEPQDALRRLYERAGQWLNLTTDKIDLGLKRAREATKELAELFKLDIGLTDIESRAEKALETAGATAPLTPAAGTELLLVDPTDVDPTTGMMGRKGFEFALRRAVQHAAEHQEPASLVQMMLDTTAPDASSRLSVLIKKHFTPTGAGLCRLTDKVYSAIAVGASDREMLALANTVRSAFTAGGERLHLGVVHFGHGSGVTYKDPSDVVRAAVAALNANRTARPAGDTKAA